MTIEGGERVTTTDTDKLARVIAAMYTAMEPEERDLDETDYFIMNAIDILVGVASCSRPALGVVLVMEGVPINAAVSIVAGSSNNIAELQSEIQYLVLASGYGRSWV